MGALAQPPLTAPLAAVGPAARSPLAVAVRDCTTPVDLLIGVAAAAVARAEMAPRPQQLVVREVQAKRRRLLESASLMRVVVEAVAVQASAPAADLRLPVVQEELVAAEPAGVLADQMQRQELQVRRIPVAVVVLVDIATHRYCPPPAVQAARASSWCDTRFRPFRCQTLIRQVRHTTPVPRTLTTSHLSRLCASRAQRPSVPRCNLKWRRHLLPAIQTLRRAPGRILARPAQLIPRPARGHALQRHLLEEPPTSSALPRQRHWTARPTRRHPRQRYQ